MANDTLPMSSFFPTCFSVLQDLLRPIHYQELTELALKQLGLTRDDVNWERQIEDVREKMLSAERYNTFYTGSPYCYGAIKNWFENEQLFLFNSDVSIPRVIAGNASSGVIGAFESLMRYPHMVQKNKFASLENRVYGCAKGLVIEQHMIDWFTQKWPSLILSPDNHRQWDQACDHDFRIKYDNDRVLLVDIWGPNKTGVYNKPPRKKKTHLHLQCRLDSSGKNVIWESVISGRLYEELRHILPLLGKSPTQMIVWLNCLAHDIPYNEVKKCVV